MGKDGFQWFVGVVEDRNDPKTLGRVRVRCLGYHTEDLTKLPTSDLPWAHVMNPITSATVSGIGQSPLGAVEGTWVVGFFTDGSDAQQPMIMGTLPGVPAKLPTKDATRGFQDVTNANYPKYLETDVNRLAVNEKIEDDNGEISESNPHSTLTILSAHRDLAVVISQIDVIFDVVAPIDSDLDTTFWDEPATEYNATYPRNHVYESEGGHIREIDATPGAERIHERHNSGSGYEIFPNGTKVTRVKGKNYNIVSDDEYCHIQGTARETIDKGLRIRVNAEGITGNNYNIEVGQGSNVNVEVNGGNINLTTLGTGEDAGDININASRDLNVQVGRNMTMDVSETITETSKSKTQSTQNTHQQNAALHDINGNRIDLN